MTDWDRGWIATTWKFLRAGPLLLRVIVVDTSLVARVIREILKGRCSLLHHPSKRISKEAKNKSFVIMILTQLSYITSYPYSKHQISLQINVKTDFLRQISRPPKPPEHTSPMLQPCRLEALQGILWQKKHQYRSRW